jgi:hypothetical protein
MHIDGDGVDVPVAYTVVPSLGLHHGCRGDASMRELGARKRKDTICDNRD